MLATMKPRRTYSPSAGKASCAREVTGTAGNKAMTYGAARNMARELAGDALRNYWTPCRFPVDPIKIACSAGVEVYDSRLGGDRWGLLVGGDNSATMYLDAIQPPSRKRVSAAHELGHYLTHAAAVGFDGFKVRPLGGGEGYSDARSDEGGGNVFEVMADEFAYSLLMPEREFREMREISRSAIDLASYFKVPVDTVSYRAKQLDRHGLPRTALLADGVCVCKSPAVTGQ